MIDSRLFKHADYIRPSAGEPIRSVVTQSDQAAVIVWYIEPGQRIVDHCHPHGQDTWIVLSGQGRYQLDDQGAIATIGAGDIIVAHSSQIHGVINDGDTPLIFVSVVSPAAAGYQLR